jgi:pSer/pThr/pTyr-binding forkhead associated (FHA) protein
MAPERALIADMGAAQDQQFDIVLAPISHPDMGEIRIDDTLFAIGRTESPFVGYEHGAIAELSRRHARIFSEYGKVYVADLRSKNGTIVNGVRVQQQPWPLRDGDEICFGKHLSYRVQIVPRAPASEPFAKHVDLTLVPERGDLGLEPIIVGNFPFLIGKSDEKFARHRADFPHQVNYLSRRHAHIFLKGNVPYVEDLGSVNGTFVAGKRLDEHAVPLRDGQVIAFGGHHFVYRVSLANGPPVEATLTNMITTTAHAAQEPGDSDKTTFIEAADSFLNIFCIDSAVQPDDDAEVAAAGDESNKQAAASRARGKVAIFWSELIDALGRPEKQALRRLAWGGLSATAALAIVALALYLSGSSEREVRELIASGAYAEGAVAAATYIRRHPDAAELKTLGSQALLKAHLPDWLSLLKARQFDKAAAALAAMKQVGAGNDDVQPLLGELEWIGDLERFVVGRGGEDAPIRIYADEDRLRSLVRVWSAAVTVHQNNLARVSSYVPAFRDLYAEALSHLRKLQSDDAVYLPAIERLNSAIEKELSADHPENLNGVVQEYAQKYSRLGGLDRVRDDLRQYLAIQSELRARRLGALIGLLDKVKFSTPPFQSKFRAVAASGQLPPANVIEQYAAVSQAWRKGDTKQAFAALQAMAAGPWGDAAAKHAEHLKAILERFAQLQQLRGAKEYVPRLLSFYGSLDLQEDAYFARSVEADIAAYKETALGQARELLERARTQWRQYRDMGAIDNSQRLDDAISSQFRTQARLLADAHEGVQQGVVIYTQLRSQLPAQWAELQEQVNAESQTQRKLLLDLRTVLEPRLLKQKLDLLGYGGGDQ